MKIDPTVKTVAPLKAAETGAGKGSAAPHRTHTVQDQVALTDSAARLRELEARLAELDITDPARVEAVRQAIAEGRFQVDPEAVADGMIREAIELLRQQIR